MWKLLLLQTVINNCFPLTAIIAIALVRWELARLCPSLCLGVVCDTLMDHGEMCDHIHPRCCLEQKPKQHFGTISAVIVPPAQASWSIQRCVRSICLWLETRTHGFRHGSVHTRKLCRLWAMPSTWDLYVCKDFITEIARAGGEEISPQDRFGAWPIRKPCLNNTAIEALQSHKPQKVSVLILNNSQKPLHSKQSQTCFFLSSHCSLRAGVSAKMFTYSEALLSLKAVTRCTCTPACQGKYVHHVFVTLLSGTLCQI